MKKEKSTKMITIFTVICALVAFISLFFSSLLPLYLSYKFKIDIRNAGSIGIIGGADGPTTIYVSGQSSSHLFTAIFALLTILGFIYLVVIKYKKNHN
ncbi:Na+-transporting oxaloacetate decarboxylase beta subunit [Geosporobacter subterraneus DSM 17957]|jgi:Na+-transporting methylmalonyl-CoA/oxaloacetate decarboxylase beta subunit|uniref:Na+-transporting oxaloacetate decarboxylase beta subunit n=1 Tax=Geosporobacter subterraneus DSM 17957 TaxID=1121919 RepID=A0A1M6NPJ4_9FIRM|nr:sodium ion-translocating decarboxylase subunit beta [Geosporobacter subterraneus]SHJ97492.1 Na+-transporting oxaloacetate decarboxylase beta subunit [Geosporobacter subterraneus DSM 17957]